MENNFEQIFKKANDIYQLNKEIQTKRDEETKQLQLEKEQSIKNKRINNVSNFNYELDCYSKELLNLIKKFKFKIESYEKFTNFSEDDYDPILEIYYCKFNNWSFEIKNISDADIEEGIFSLTNIKNDITNEKIDFYCDLGCRNTGEDRLKEVLNFFNYNSLQRYINNRYKKYIDLPNLLRNKGYNVEEVDYAFNLNEPKGYLKLDENLFVKVYRAWDSDLKFVVTNNEKWDVNSGNHSIDSYDGKAYFFNYNSGNDIDELCKCIEAFKNDQAERIGFYEKGEYFNNKYIYYLFDRLRDKKDYYKEAWNHDQIQVEHKDFWDYRGYDEENSLITNKYKGLEIYTETELTFNDASQWTIGDYANKSIIIFEYDKRKNDKQCKLHIDNYIYKDRDWEISTYNEETGEYDYKPDKNKLVGSVECYGSFSELYTKLDTYINKMCYIHQIQL